MIILALDISSKVGWAVGSERGRVIASGTENFVDCLRDFPEMAVQFERWLGAKITNSMANHVVVEQPTLSARSTSIYMLSGLVFLAHKVARQHDTYSYEVATARWRRLVAHEMGREIPTRRTVGKTLVKDWAREKMGRDPIDDNEADAWGILAWSFSIQGPGGKG